MNRFSRDQKLIAYSVHFLLTTHHEVAMNKNTVIKFSKTKQSRSKNTLNDLLDAADKLVSDADPKKFTARSLAQKSGYALGTLLNRLESVENVFLWAIEKQKDKHIQAVVKIVEDFDRNKTIQELGELLVDWAFLTFTKVNPKVMQFIESRLIKKNQFSTKYFHFMNPIAIALFECSKKNTSNTMRSITKDEAILLTRSVFMIAERPFAEDSPIAGSKEHRRIVIEGFVRLFGS